MAVLLTTPGGRSLALTGHGMLAHTRAVSAPWEKLHEIRSEGADLEVTDIQSNGERLLADASLWRGSSRREIGTLEILADGTVAEALRPPYVPTPSGSSRGAC